ncbi:MAG: hypothetical protein HC836_10705 [Richelia sp. RM2_1_2]|nr:hypothetical protein [Richelia sp. RM2_1_2]
MSWKIIQSQHTNNNGFEITITSVSPSEHKAILQFLSTLPRDEYTVSVEDFLDADLLDQPNFCIDVWVLREAQLIELNKLIKSFPKRNHLVVIQDAPPEFFTKSSQWMTNYIQGNWIKFPNPAAPTLRYMTERLYVFEHQYEAELFLDQLDYGVWNQTPSNKYLPLAKLHTKQKISCSLDPTISHTTLKEIHKWLDATVQTAWSSYRAYEKVLTSDDDACLFKLTWAEAILGFTQ